MRPRAVAGLLATAALAAACSGGGPPGPDPPWAAGDPGGRPRCDAAPGRSPVGFVLVGQRERRYADHVGVHETLRAPDGRRLDYLLGVTGETGEGLPLEAMLPLISGAEGRLLGRAETWILVWDAPRPCAQNTIVGNGMTRREFLDVLRGAGVLPQPAGPGDG